MKLKSSQAKETNGETDTGDKQRGPWEGLNLPRGAAAPEPALKQEWEFDSWGRRRAQQCVIHGLDDTEEGQDGLPVCMGEGVGTEEIRSDITWLPA